MAGPRPHLDLEPERCDLCGRCLEACDRESLRIGQGYVYVDWAACEGCAACADACEAGAIRRKGEPAVGAPAAPAARLPLAVTEGAVTTIRAGADPAQAPADAAAPSREAIKAASRASDVPPGSIHWTVAEVLAVLAAGIALLIAKDLVLTSDAFADAGLQGLVAMRAAAQAVYYAALLALLAWLAKRRGVGFRQAFGLRAASLGTSAAWVLSSLLVVRLLSTMYGGIAQFLGWDPPVRAASDLAAWFGPDIFGLVLATVTIVLVGPFVEEVVFRGMLLPALRGVMSRRLAIVGSALLFAASHVTLWTFVPLALLGVAAGWLAISRRSVWPAVALHMGYNAVAVFAAFYVAGAVGG